MSDGVGQEDYTWDQLGRRTQVVKKIYNVNYTTAYTYNLAGEAVNMTYPSGRVVKHEYDAIGRVQNVKNNATQATYAGSATYSTASQLTGFSYGNSVSASYGYSAQRLQLASLAYAQGGSNLLSLSYGYAQSGNNNGQIASITDNVQSGRTATYTYDSLHRLKTSVTTGSAGYPQWGLSWTYDRYGNRTAQSVTAGSGPSNSVTVNAATNRITAMGAATFFYDLNGNLTQDDLYKYKYDAENRMVEIRLLNNTLVSTYAFDGHSLRVIKVVGADRTWSIYAGTELVAEYDDAASNTYAAGTNPGAAGSDSTATILYQHADHLTTRLTTENNGDLSNEQAHYPYGEKWYETGTANPSVPRKFTSYMKEDEAATGKLNYAVFREHSARIGRFHMADPVRGRVGNPQRLNRYAYVMNNPTNRTDRRGLDDIDSTRFIPIYEGDMGTCLGPGCIGGTVGATEAWHEGQQWLWNETRDIPVGNWVNGWYVPPMPGVGPIDPVPGLLMDGSTGLFGWGQGGWRCWGYYACVAGVTAGCIVGLGSVAIGSCEICMSPILTPAGNTLCLGVCAAGVALGAAYVCYNYVAVPSCRVTHPGCP